MIRDNPFSSKIFTSCWSKHFNNGIKPISFEFLNEVCCYKSKIPNLYINVGKNLTKGISYSINNPEKKEIRGKTFLFYDVFTDSSASGVFNEKAFNGFGHFSIRQYPGYSIHLKSFNSLEDYMHQTFQKSSRYKLRKYKRRLEQCFDISFKSVGSDISKEEYDSLFERFRILLEKRFYEKKTHNNNLDKSEWDFYKDVALPLIKEKKATLFVLYNRDVPISITLGYLSDKRIFDAITVFDTDYAKFHLGSIKIMYLINWAITNKWDVLDFSKGHFDYKTRWSNKKYDFHYHILYDKNSFASHLTAQIIKSYFGIKQYLRERKINEQLNKFTFMLKGKKIGHYKYEFSDWKEDDSYKKRLQLNPNNMEYRFLKRMCFDFLYLFQEKEEHLELFSTNEMNIYLIKGLSSCKLLRLK